MLKAYINGRFLAKPVTGTERFAREILVALDNLLSEAGRTISVTCLVPTSANPAIELKAVKIVKTGRFQGHAWEQWDLFRAARNGVLVNLTNSAPVLHPNQWTIIHDALVYRQPLNYARSYRLFHQTLGHILSYRSRIGTVSDFSRDEIATILRRPAAEIEVFANGREHIYRQTPDERIVTKLGVASRPYFLFVGSPSPSKNLSRAIQAFASLRRAEAAFVIVGNLNKSVFCGDSSGQTENVIMAGRLSDAEVAALYRGARALVFPSLYEGFGIPPLEAMTLGCPVIASDIPPVREVCGDAVVYFDPTSVAEIGRCMTLVLDNAALRAELVEKGLAQGVNFSWWQTANKLLGKMEEAALGLGS